MHIETLARNYERLLVAGLALIPGMIIAYLVAYTDPAIRFETHAGHEVAILIATLTSGFVSYVSWRSYRESGEVFLRWLTAGFIAFTLIYALHGALTRTAHHNMLLFLLYGPVSRLVMIACIVIGFISYGKAGEDPLDAARAAFWRRLVLVVVAIDFLVPVLAYSDFARAPWLRLTLESGALALSLITLAVMAWRKITSPLMIYYAVALAIFAQAAIAFMLAKPWNHLWWFAHVVFAGGFFILSWGVTRALLTTRSFANAYSQEKLIRDLKDEQQRLDKANRELNRARSRLQTVLDSVQDAVVSITPHGIISSFNLAATRAFGYPPDEAVGRNVSMLMPSPERDAHDGHLERFRNGLGGQGMGRVRELAALRKDGSTFPIDLVSNASECEGETVITASLRDITQRKAHEAEIDAYRNHLEELVERRTEELARAKEVAERASLAKTQFLANMSHELRTPLNGIIGMAELMGQTPMPREQSARLARLQGAARHLVEVITDILDIAKIESGKMKLQVMPVSIGQILRNVQSIIGVKAESKGITLVVESDPCPRHLLGDATRLQQALLNYGANAVKFTDKGTVTLRAKILAEDDAQVQVRFEVTDTGMGIDPQDLPRLFAPFEQADNSMTRRFGGTGLGLAITRNLAHLMGGEVGAESELGLGSTFWFTARLKVGAASDRPAEDEVSATELVRLRYPGRRVLLVDDDALNLDVIRGMLEQAALAVDVATDGNAAFKLASSDDYDLVFMDLHMPGIDGFEATRMIRQFSGQDRLPIIAITANALAGQQARCYDAGMNDLLVKPIDMEGLLGMVMKWLAHDRAQPAQ